MLARLISKARSVGEVIAMSTKFSGATLRNVGHGGFPKVEVAVTVDVLLTQEQAQRLQEAINRFAREVRSHIRVSRAS